MFGDAHVAIKERMSQLKGGGFGQGKRDGINQMVASLDLRGWDHPTFNDIVNVAGTKEFRECSRTFRWGQLSAKLGGNAGRKSAWDAGSIEEATTRSGP